MEFEYCINHAWDGGSNLQETSVPTGPSVPPAAGAQSSGSLNFSFVMQLFRGQTAVSKQADHAALKYFFCSHLF